MAGINFQLKGKDIQINGLIFAAIKKFSFLLKECSVLLINFIILNVGSCINKDELRVNEGV